MTDGLFDNVSADDQSGQNTENQNTDGDQTVYIGEGKKYSSVTDADNAFGHLNQHVDTLEKENADLRAQAEKAKGIDEVLEAMKHQSQDFSVQGNNSQTSESNHQGLDEDAIAKVVENRLTEMKQSEVSEANGKQVIDALTEKYGDKAADMYKSKAQELGVNLDDLSRVSPKAVLAYFNQNVQSRTSSAEASSYNTTTLNSNQPKHGTHDYWNELQKSGSITREEKFRRQHESLSSLGEDAYWHK